MAQNYARNSSQNSTQHTMPRARVGKYDTNRETSIQYTSPDRQRQHVTILRRPNCKMVTDHDDGRPLNQPQKSRRQRQLTYTYSNICFSSSCMCMPCLIKLICFLLPPYSAWRVTLFLIFLRHPDFATIGLLGSQNALLCQPVLFSTP